MAHHVSDCNARMHCLQDSILAKGTGKWLHWTKHPMTKTLYMSAKRVSVNVVAWSSSAEGIDESKMFGVESGYL
eukprot:13441-Amphidinium_carterae.1